MNRPHSRQVNRSHALRFGSFVAIASKGGMWWVQASIATPLSLAEVTRATTFGAVPVWGVLGGRAQAAWSCWSRFGTVETACILALFSLACWNLSGKHALMFLMGII